MFIYINCRKAKIIVTDSRLVIGACNMGGKKLTAKEENRDYFRKEKNILYFD